MMTSENSLEQVYVWIWLHGATEPVVAGVLSRDNGRFIFNYGRSYLERKEAIAVYVPELPLVRERNCTCPRFASEVDRKLFWGRMFLILSYLKARQKRF